MFIIGWAGGAVGAVAISVGGLVRAQGCRFLLPWCGSTCGSVTPGVCMLQVQCWHLQELGLPRLIYSLFRAGGAAATGEGIAEERMEEVADVKSEGRER